MQELKTLTITLDELKDVNENTIIEPIASNFDAAYEAGSSLDRVEAQFRKMQKSVGQTMACMASAMWQEAINMDVKNKPVAERKKLIEAEVSAQLKKFLGMCAAAASRYKAKHNRTTVPESTTQAKKEIKAAWEAGVNLLEFNTLYKMRKETKAIRDLIDKQDDEAALQEYQEQNGIDNVVPVSGDATTKATETKATLKVEGIEPDSELGKELKAYMDAIVNAHNNQSGQGDTELCEAISAARGKLGKTVLHIANKLSGENQKTA